MSPVRPDLALLVARSDQDGDAWTQPKIYQLVSPFDFAPMLTATGFGLQGVAQYALYVSNRLYVPNAPMAELQALAAYVITETASQDGKVSVGPVVIREGRDLLHEVLYSVTLPSGYVATGPDSYSPEPIESPVPAVVREHRRQAVDEGL